MRFLYYIIFALALSTGLANAQLSPAPSGGGGGGGTVVHSGSKAISNAVDTVTVTGLGLASVPTLVIVTMHKQTGDLNIFAIVRADSITTDGFTVDLSAATDNANYKLEYIIIL